MSLFIAGLALAHSGGSYYAGDKLGILIASTLAALAALFVLNKALPKHAAADASTGFSEAEASGEMAK